MVKYASVTQSKLSCIMKKYKKLMKHLQQKLIVICKSFNQSVYFVLIAFMFYLIVRRTSSILMFSTRKKNYLICPTFWFEKNPPVCLSVFSVLPLPLPWSSLNPSLLVTEKFWKKESRKKCLIYITLSIVLCGKIKIWNNLSVATTDVAMETSISCSWGEIKDDLSVKIWSQLSIVNSFLLKYFSIRYPTEKWSEQNKSATRKYCIVSKF